MPQLFSAPRRGREFAADPGEGLHDPQGAVDFMAASTWMTVVILERTLKTMRNVTRNGSKVARAGDAAREFVSWWSHPSDRAVFPHALPRPTAVKQKI